MDERARSGGAVLACIALLALGACGLGGEKQSFEDAAQLTGGHPHAGRKKAREYGCGSCHTIRGVPGATSMVGPPLTGMGERMYIAGTLTNTPQHLIRWIQDPPSIDSATAMPNVGVTEADARDIAAYLYAIP